MSDQESYIDQEVYLGDGLYGVFDGFHVKLRAPRFDGDHWVALEPEVMIAFQRYLAALARVHPELQTLWNMRPKAAPG
jgi:hypothetical protein